MLNFNKFQTKGDNYFLKIISKINIKFIITFICLIFLGYSIYENFESLSNQRINTEELLWLLLAIIFSSLSVIINAYAWKLLINNIGCCSNRVNIIKLFLVTNIYKYLPGGIWHFVSRYNALRLEFSTEKSVESILLEPLLMLVSGLLFVPFGGSNIFIFTLCWSSVLVFLPGLREIIIKKLKTLKATIFTYNDQPNNRSLALHNQNISKKIFYPYKPLFVEIIFIIFRFLGFLCCVKAFSIGSLASQGELLSSFSFAWIIGLVVPAAPGGVGVFESVILFRLGSHLPEASLLASLLCYRLVSTVADIFSALIFPIKRLLKV